LELRGEFTIFFRNFFFLEPDLAEPDFCCFSFTYWALFKPEDGSISCGGVFCGEQPPAKICWAS